MKAFIGFLLISLGLILGSTTISVGQNPPQPLWYSGVAEDNTCYWDQSDQNCSVADFVGCNTITITPPTTGTYYLNVWIECSPSHPNCGGCYAEAYLVRVSDGAPVITPCCTDQNCSASCSGKKICPPSPGATLEAGMSYKLYVCKKPCGASVCTWCSTDCVAKAEIVD